MTRALILAAGDEPDPWPGDPHPPPPPFRPSDPQPPPMPTPDQLGAFDCPRCGEPIGRGHKPGCPHASDLVALGVPARRVPLHHHQP